MAFCAELNLPYTETGPVASYAATLRHLHAVGASLRAGRVFPTLRVRG